MISTGKEKLRKGGPVEYSIGFVDFLGAKIDLSLRPLIPRPETKFWVRKVIREIQNKKAKNIQVLDLFAGSGCVGIAILKTCPDFCRRVDFAEIDGKFLNQIEINLKLNKISRTKYKLIQSDVFENIKGKYLYILANPPYVAESRKNEVQKSVLDFEPKKSLFGGNDGLFFIKKFLKEARFHLKNGGKIYLEFDPQQKEEVRKILIGSGHANHRFFKDQYGKWRYLILRLRAQD